MEAEAEVVHEGADQSGERPEDLYQRLMAFVEDNLLTTTCGITHNDEVIDDKGVRVFIDSGAVMYLLGTEMDYKEKEMSSTFVFNNPNETERCGCGESFKIT